MCSNAKHSVVISKLSKQNPFAAFLTPVRSVRQGSATINGTRRLTGEVYWDKDAVVTLVVAEVWPSLLGARSVELATVAWNRRYERSLHAPAHLHDTRLYHHLRQCYHHLA